MTCPPVSIEAARQSCGSVITTSFQTLADATATAQVLTLAWCTTTFQATFNGTTSLYQSCYRQGCLHNWPAATASSRPQHGCVTFQGYRPSSLAGTAMQPSAHSLQLDSLPFVQVFVKGLCTADGQLQLRGHAFALSATHSHYSKSGRHFSQDPAALHWAPRIWLAHGDMQWDAAVGQVEDWHEQDDLGQARIVIPIR